MIIVVIYPVHGRLLLGAVKKCMHISGPARESWELAGGKTVDPAVPFVIF